MSTRTFVKPKFVTQLPSDSVETPVRSGNQRYWEISDILRSRPGQWARVAVEATYYNTVASAIRNGGALAFKPAGSFEAKRFVRTLSKDERQEFEDQGRHVEKVAEVYARYVGEEA